MTSSEYGVAMRDPQRSERPQCAADGLGRGQRGSPDASVMRFTVTSS